MGNPIKCLSCGIYNYGDESRCKRCDADLVPQTAPNGSTPTPVYERLDSTRSPNFCVSCGSVTTEKTSFRKTYRHWLAIPVLVVGVILSFAMAGVAVLFVTNMVKGAQFFALIGFIVPAFFYSKLSQRHHLELGLCPRCIIRLHRWDVVAVSGIVAFIICTVSSGIVGTIMASDVIGFSILGAGFFLLIATLVGRTLARPRTRTKTREHVVFNVPGRGDVIFYPIVNRGVANG